MRARSDKLREQALPKSRVLKRLPAEQRRREIIEKAADFFAEFGLTGQTRQLAAACGVSQRLLYSLFPNKAALLDEVYRHAIAGPFKAIWMVQLRDRRVTIERRLEAFYRDYEATILTKRWVRLLLYCSLAGDAERDSAAAPRLDRSETTGNAGGCGAVAPAYTDRILNAVLDVIACEALEAQALPVPPESSSRQQVAWVLHGMVTHSALRRHVYGTGSALGPKREIELYVQAFLRSLPTIVDTLASDAKRARSAPLRDELVDVTLPNDSQNRKAG